MISKFLDAIVGVFRFLNLLEPGRKILSITKVVMWLSVGLFLYSALTDRQINLETVAFFLGATGAYGWRRWVFWKQGKLGTDGGPA